MSQIKEGEVVEAYMYGDVFEQGLQNRRRMFREVWKLLLLCKGVLIRLRFLVSKVPGQGVILTAVF